MKIDITQIMRKLLLILTLILLVSGLSSATFIGTSPGIGEHGTLERGETYQFSIGIITDANTDFSINPQLTEPDRDFFNPSDDNSAYEFNPNQASREDISDWVTFSQPRYEIDPSTTVEGTTVEGQITYYIEVPRDAEPGYHAADITLNNNLNSQSSGTIRTLGLTEYTFIFKVPGEVERRLTLEDVRGLRSGDDRARLEMDVSNEGSVTVLLENYSSNIFTSNGQRLDNVKEYSREKIAPGETKTIQKQWTYSDDITAGEYRLRGTMNYITGTAFVDNSFDISSFIEIEPSNQSGGGGNILPSGDTGDSPPMMLIVIFLVLSGALLYAFEIDPLLIIMVLGMVSISSFIWFAGLPAYLIGMVVIISAGVFYYGWM